MRKLATALSAVLALGTLFFAGAAPCRADVTTHAAALAAAPAPGLYDAPQPGTHEEERSYARREAESSAAQDFTGGIIGFLILVALVIIIILLVKDGVP